ncbi:MAG: bifunctional phosphoribosylaminoimidazolecarboxamide formyltransferase/IMP cyclohydrolase [Verrucomicrobiota bacterium]|nr:bifunctional phosphoribosylaminoimidazolecarboxamide formyltransferase/IMP cyclohydrolase [Verrucomicrobiota bacterium]
MPKIERALISVSDKTDIVPFAEVLSRAGVEIISTGGTASVLREAGIEVQDLSDYTGFPEMLDGRVKTLHPKVHGGLLFLRENTEHTATAAEHGIRPIDLVVVNLYPFEQTVAKPDVTLGDAIENIDIGGPSMLRSAAKNHQSVTVIVDPADYGRVADQVSSGGETTLELRRELAVKVYSRTAAYDGAIALHLANVYEQEQPSADLPGKLVVRADKAQDLRYGENPHQRASLYGRFGEFYQQLHGKALSYNNILDLTAAAGLIVEFDAELPTLAILKHTNACGLGQADILCDAWDKAYATDRQAPFGGIIACNTTLDLATAEAISEIFTEVIVAPDFEVDALELLQQKKNLRLAKLLLNPANAVPWDVRSVGAESFLVQERDLRQTTAVDLEIVTERHPSEDELKAMLFGWRAVKHVKSNAIVYAAKDRTLGVGAGQMSRVDASRIAVWKAGEAGLDLNGSVVCSDAFFPFADGLIAAAEAGATAAIQPGGSKRDDEVIAAANERSMAMAFTGGRHFRH